MNGSNGHSLSLAGSWPSSTPIHVSTSGPLRCAISRQTLNFAPCTGLEPRRRTAHGGSRRHTRWGRREAARQAKTKPCWRGVEIVRCSVTGWWRGGHTLALALPAKRTAWSFWSSAGNQAFGELFWGLRWRGANQTAILPLFEISRE
jgi:hypothetical protein